MEKVSRLRAAIGKVIALKTATPREEERMIELRSTIRLAAEDIVRLVREVPTVFEDNTTASSVQDALLTSICESIFSILYKEVQSATESESKLRRAELEVDFMTQLLERREKMAGEHRAELLKELQQSTHAARFLTQQLRQTQEESRRLRELPPCDKSTSISLTTTMLATSQTSVIANLPPLPDPQSIGQRLEADWLAAVKEEEHHAREAHVKYEAEQKLKALQVKLRLEQDVTAQRHAKRFDDAIRKECAKLEAKTAQLEQQLRKKEMEVDVVIQQERERWRAQAQRVSDHNKTRFIQALLESKRRVECAMMFVEDVKTQSSNREELLLRQIRQLSSSIEKCFSSSSSKDNTAPAVTTTESPVITSPQPPKRPKTKPSSPGSSLRTPKWENFSATIKDALAEAMNTIAAEKEALIREILELRSKSVLKALSALSRKPMGSGRVARQKADFIAERRRHWEEVIIGEDTLPAIDVSTDAVSHGVSEALQKSQQALERRAVAFVLDFSAMTRGGHREASGLISNTTQTDTVIIVDIPQGSSMPGGCFYGYPSSHQYDAVILVGTLLYRKLSCQVLHLLASPYLYSAATLAQKLPGSSTDESLRIASAATGRLATLGARRN